MKMPTGIEPALPDAERHDGNGHGLDDLADEADPAPVVLVGDVADDEGEDQHRQELDEAEKAQCQGAVGLVVDQPADSDDGAIEPQRRENARGDKVPERAVAAKQTGVDFERVGCGSRRGHRSSRWDDAQM